MDDTLLLLGGARRRRQVFGVSWDKSSSPTLTRTDSAVGLTAAVGALDGTQFANTLAVLGVSWDKSSNPALTRTDSATGLTAAVGPLAS